MHNTPRIATGITIPPLLVDESIGGYLQRIAILTRAGGLKPVVREFVGVKLIQARWLLPSHLEQLSAKLAPALPSGEQLLTEHTIFPAVRPFLALPAQRVLSTRMLGRGTSMGSYFLVGLAHRGAAESRVVRAYCAECANEDLQAHGFAYWHRSHQIPYLSTCGKHGTSLLVGAGCCPAMEQASRFARLPLQDCGCPSSPRRLDETLTETSRRLDQKLSALVGSMLTFGWPSDLERESIGREYAARFSAKGFRRGAYMSPPLAAESFQVFAPDDLLRKLGCQVRGDHGWFADAVRGKAPASVIKNALLVAFLYEDLHCFVDSVLAAPVQQRTVRRRTSPPHRPNPLPVSIAGTSAFLARRDDYRQRLKTWMATCAKPTRTAAQRMFGYVSLWLRTHDGAWYDATLPAVSAARHSVVSTELWEAHRRAADEEGLRHVQRRHEQLLHPDTKPVRITKAKLLEGLRYSALRRPRTAEAIKLKVETSQQFKERLVLWIMDNPHAVPPWRGGALGYAYARTHISKARIVELVAEAHRRSHPQTLTTAAAEVPIPTGSPP